MEELVKQLVVQAGIDPSTARKVADFIRQHLDQLRHWIDEEDLDDTFPGGLGSRLA